ncbi:MAG TPA: thioredoxin family protein, partial [bacterium]|nr:thioredoxin family protein [bacterium]
FALTSGIYVLAALLLAAGIGLGALHLSLHHTGWMVRARKTVGVFLCVLTVYLTVGTQAAVRASELNWINNLEEGLARAKQEGKPVLIDFWAEWCAICKEIDHYTLRAPAVEEALKRFVTIKIDLTDPNTGKNQEIMQSYKIPGLPLIVFYDAQGTLLEQKKITGFINQKDFLQHISDIR